jgi:hypothetical protein
MQPIGARLLTTTATDIRRTMRLQHGQGKHAGWRWGAAAPDTEQADAALPKSSRDTLLLLLAGLLWQETETEQQNSPLAASQAGRGAGAARLPPGQ